MKKLLTSFLMTTLAVGLYSQNLQNGDLEGTVTNSTSVIPVNWQYVPETDPVCLAASAANATPDLTGPTGPDVGNGLCGNPYTGGSFVSALHANSASNYWHEGIMQNVSGFIPGGSYTITLFQTVVKQINCLDTSGSWMVYMDNTLIGITTPSSSNLPFSSTNLVWDQRAFNFTAPSSGSITLKLLPWDDDTLHLLSMTDISGGLRMGIDNITFSQGKVGIDESNTDPYLFLYPNPCIDQFFIHLNEKASVNPVQIEVLDSYGNIVMEYEDEFFNGFAIDIQEYESGVYYVRFLMSDERYIVYKIVKQ